MEKKEEEISLESLKNESLTSSSLTPIGSKIILSHARSQSQNEGKSLINNHRRSFSDNSPDYSHEETPKTTAINPNSMTKSSVMTPIFSKGFSKYLETGFLSDLLLIHLKNEYHVHQVKKDEFKNFPMTFYFLKKTRLFW